MIKNITNIWRNPKDFHLNSPERRTSRDQRERFTCSLSNPQPALSPFPLNFCSCLPLQIPEKSLTSIPMYGTIIYYKESRKAPGKEAYI